MQSNKYALLTSILLGGAVAGCSPDQQAETAKSSAAVQPPSPTASTPPVAAPASPVAPGRAAAPKPLRENVTTKALPKAAVIPSRPPRWVAKYAVASATSTGESKPIISTEATAPKAQPELMTQGQKSADNLPSLAASAPDPADNDLQAFCAQAAPALQVFRVRAGRDTVLVGQQGTRLVVPALAFDVPASSGPVELRLREFYSTSDIVLAGLGTRAGLDLLETGGMLHLDAAADGQTVHLRPSMQILVQLPTKQQQPGMQLFEGVSNDASHAPDWQLPATGNPASSRASLGKWVALHPPKSPRWPRLDMNEKAFLKEFERLMPDSKADQARLRRKRTVPKEERLLLKELSAENHTAIRHAIVFEVVVDSAGTLLPPQRVAGDSVLGDKALAALKQLPALHAASFMSTLPHGRRTVSTARGVFSVLYARSGRRLVGFTWQLMDKQLTEELAKEAQRSRAEFARQFNSKGKGNAPLTLDGGLYYELVAGGLGWINCDRLLDPGPRIEYAVQAPAPATVVSLVFKGQRSILASSRTDGATAVFEQVPSGQAATIVALRREKGITYLATTGVSLGQATPPDLQFRPVTLEQLRTELASL
jgi:hypothetical protein